MAKSPSPYTRNVPTLIYVRERARKQRKGSKTEGRGEEIERVAGCCGGVERVATMAGRCVVRGWVWREIFNLNLIIIWLRDKISRKK